MEKITKTVLFAGLFLSPLVIWPWAKIPYELPRVWFLLRFIELLVVSGLIIIAKTGEIKKTNYRLILLSAVFLAVAIISSIWGANFPKSVFGNFYRGDGLITLLHLIAFSLIISLVWDRSYSILVSYAITLGSFLTSVLTLTMSFLVIGLGMNSLPHWENRAVGATFGNPNLLAGYLVVTMPLIIYLFQKSNKSRQKLFWLIVLIIQVLAIIATNSWGGLLGIILGISGWLMMRNKFWTKIYIVLIILSILGEIFIIFNQQRVTGFVAESRERIVRKILLAVSQRPLLGYGWANTDYAFASSEWPIRLQHDVYVDKAHSTILEVLAATGLIGLFVYSSIIIKTGRLLYGKIFQNMHDKFWPKTLLLVFLLYFFHSQTNVISIAEELIFWLVLGAAMNEG